VAVRDVVTTHVGGLNIPPALHFGTKVAHLLQLLQSIGTAKVVMYLEEAIAADELCTRLNAALNDSTFAGILPVAPAPALRVLEAFRSPDCMPRVLCLCARSGAEGLDLSCAQHLVIMGTVPMRVERRLVARVAHVGVTKQAVVHRIVARGTHEDVRLGPKRV
jgi:hypothetical protein